MSGNTTRLTLYALISSIEQDLRAFVSLELLSQVNLDKLISEQTLQKLRTRAATDFEESFQVTLDNSFADVDLIHYLDFKEAFEVISGNKKLLSKGEIDFINDISPYSEAIAPIRNRVMHTRPLIIDDFSTTYDFCKFLQKNWSSKCSFLLKCLKDIESNPGYILRIEIPSWQKQDRISHNLPMPDFDETGFIGRHQDVANVKALLLGPYPVINIIGVGGVGKTALAVKVAYDLLDDEDCPFEAVVYVSSKTTTLGISEIRQIENAITDSVGIFSSINDQLGSQQTEDFKEIIEYMKVFKILLVIDNLETVLDNKIKDFLKSLPVGSKVLITSRVGVGAYDNPYPLGELDKSESLRLFKSIAKSRSVDLLIEMKQQQVDQYLAQMKYIPAFIKWFVLAVSAGRRPEEVLRQPKLVLEFCMQNVYEHLPPSAKMVLEALLSTKMNCTYSMIHYLTALSFEELDSALIHLTTSNMLIRTSRDNLTLYKITELPLLYLENFCRPDRLVVEEYRKKGRKLVADSEDIQKSFRTNPYNPNNVDVLDAHYRVVAKYLNTALKTFRNDPAKALQNVASARRAEPNYYEVHRVHAQILADTGELDQAKESYDLAVTENPNAAPLRLWFAIFLMKDFNDPKAALEHLKFAKKLDSSVREIDIEMSRALIQLGDYQGAELILNELNSYPKDATKTSLIISYVTLQLYRRKAEYLCSQRHYKEAFDALKILLECFKNMPNWHKDAQAIDLMINSKSIAEKCTMSMFAAQKTPEQYQHVLDAFTAIQHSGSIETEKIGERAFGFVTKIEPQKGYGFIKSDSGIKYFFLYRDMSEQADFYSLVENKSRVNFTTGANNRSLCAYEISVVED